MQVRDGFNTATQSLRAELQQQQQRVQSAAVLEAAPAAAVAAAAVPLPPASTQPAEDRGSKTEGLRKVLDSASLWQRIAPAPIPAPALTPTNQQPDPRLGLPPAGARTQQSEEESAAAEMGLSAERQRASPLRHARRSQSEVLDAEMGIDSRDAV